MPHRKPVISWRAVIFLAAIAWIAYTWTPNRPNPNSDRTYVRALYRAVLNRAPDQSGFASNYHALKTGKVTRKQLLQSFLNSPEHQKSL